MRARRSLSDRFQEKFERGPECWEWTASQHPFGYGLINAGGRSSPLLAHRVSWTLNFGEIPDGMHVLHRCDNPPCVRPDHLFLGDHAANMSDMTKKGRNNGCWTPDRSVTPEERARGGRVGTAKLTPDLVRELRMLYASGGHTMAELGDRFGIRPCTAFQIISRKTWKHVS
jgi:hypothetical protein